MSTLIFQKQSSLLEKTHNVFVKDNFTLTVITDFTRLKNFSCSDDDLNDFFLNEAKDYKDQLLAETYALTSTDNKKDIISLISLNNDALKLQTNNQKRIIPNPKRKKSYPSVLISRLGVNKKYADNGIGSYLLTMVKEIFLTNNRTGCRFITVEAYNKERVRNFYEINGFKYLLKEEDMTKKMETVPMYFDLKILHQ